MAPHETSEAHGEGSREGPATRPPTSLFREEALRRHFGQREHGDVLRILPRWTRWAYPIIVTLFAAGLVSLCAGSTTQFARGPAVVRGGADGHYTLVALLPASALSEVRIGTRLHVTFPDYPGAALSVEVALVGDHPLTPPDARRALGELRDEGPMMTGPMVVVQSPLPGQGLHAVRPGAAYRAGLAARVEAPAGSERWIFALLPGRSRTGPS